MRSSNTGASLTASASLSGCPRTRRWSPNRQSSNGCAARRLAQARESYNIQQSAADLARRRVEATNLLLDAGRAQSRDLLEAQDALLEAQNALVRALVDHTVARLEFLRDTEQLEVDEQAIPNGL